jgi:exodeoxyribonuclease VII small subunit
MSEQEDKQVKELSVEEGFDRLRAICDELSTGGLSLDETMERLREGHGLERRLRERLDSYEAELKAIEAGEGLLDVRIS